jgi:cyclic pyranopterin phosphate synthase
MGGTVNDTDRKPTRMVDVGEKDITFRRAVASGSIRVGRTVRKAIDAGKIPKGNVLEVARVAGIMAAKQTAALLPLCHPLPIEAVSLHLETDDETVRVHAEVRTHARTGVEMEALVAVSVACLTVYDLCKSLPDGQSAVIETIRLDEKSGGAGGHFVFPVSSGKGDVPCDSRF